MTSTFHGLNAYVNASKLPTKYPDTTKDSLILLIVYEFDEFDYFIEFCFCPFFYRTLVEGQTVTRSLNGKKD